MVEKPESATHILVVKPSSFGDIIHGLQVVASLRAQLRGPAHITWVAREIFAPIVECCAAVDETVIFHRKRGWREILRLRRELGDREWDVVLDLQGLLRSGLMISKCNAPRKIGRTDAREGAGYFFNEKAPLPKGGKHAHAVEILLQFLPLLGCKPELVQPVAFSPVEPSGFSATLLERDFILLFPDSRRPEKEWPGFFELTGRLLRSTELDVAWVGTANMEADAAWPAERFHNLLGKTSLPELTTLLPRAKLVVANDSGPMHLAAALGIPVLAIFGPTDPARFGPFPLDAPTNHVVQADGSLVDLSAEDVFQRVQSVLG